MKSIFRPIAPLPDENLTGLIARAAGANVYPHAHDIMELAGLEGIRPESVAIRTPSSSYALAEVLGTSAELLLPLYIAAVDDRRIDFYGTELRAKLRETRRRRLSPLALKDKSYIRAVWSVKPLSFDPRTKEMLISECPVCGGKLGFTQTWGIEFCEHCVVSDEDGLPFSTVDLRDFPQPRVEIEDIEALDFVTDMIDPDPQRSWDARIHYDLASLGKGQLFELALAIGAAITADDAGVFPTVGAKWRPPIDGILPSNLAQAGRVLLDWPAGAHNLLSSAAKKANDRPGDNGVYKAFGYFAVLHRDEHLRPKAQAVLAKVTDAVFVGLGTSDLALRKTTKRGPAGREIGARHLYQSRKISPQTTKRLGQHPEMLTYRESDDEFSPVFFNSWQAHSVVDHFQDLVSEASVCTTLGLPPDAVRDLYEIGLARDLKSPFRSIAIDLMNGGNFYSKFFAKDFAEMLSCGLPFERKRKGFIPFSEAMLMFPVGKRPWLPMMMPILFQDVDAVFHHNVAAQPKTRNLFGSISVNAHQIEQYRERILKEHALARQHDLGRVSAVMSIMILGLYNHLVFMALDEANLIDVNEDGADYQSLIDFAGEYIFLNEAAVRSRSSRQMVRPWLEARGIKPEFEFDCKGGTIYSRAKVEPWLEMKV